MKTEILVICENEQIMRILERLINKNEVWHGVGVPTETAALETLRNQHFDLVLLGSGTESALSNDMKMAFLETNPNLIIVAHYGGGSGLLTAEIMGALAVEKK